LYDEESSLAVLAWARIDNRQELAGKLTDNGAGPDFTKLTDAEIILRAYKKWRDDCIQHLIGDFVFVIYDLRREEVFCARDHLGVRPFYYLLKDEIFACTTHLANLSQLNAAPVNIDRQWLVDFIVGLSMSFDRTPYKEIKKLPPGHYLKVSRERHELVQYFKIGDETEIKLADSQEYVELWRETLEEAIRCRLVSDYPMGCELSGGIDSSTIAAFGARFYERPLTDFHTFGFARLEMEPEYIFAVSQMYGLPHNHIVSGSAGNYNETLERSFNILGYPYEHGNSVSHEPFYKLAETFGIRTLLSGFGGDEFGTTIHGYMVPMEMLLQRQFKELHEILPGSYIFRWLRLLKMELKRIKTDNFSKPGFHPGMLQAMQAKAANSLLRPELNREFAVKERYHDIGCFDGGYTDLKKFTIERRWQPFIPTRMENCFLMAAARKIEYRWPLLDVRLVRLFFQIPAREHFYRGMGRYLHRRAINGVVPDLVAWKKSKYMGDNILRSMSGQSGPMRSQKKTAAERKEISFNELHSQLGELIDEKRFFRQQKLAATVVEGDLPPGVRTARRNLADLQKLDRWLKRYSTH
jgi:asparagine synthase (glutamine-hydrolysing)